MPVTTGVSSPLADHTTTIAADADAEPNAPSKRAKPPKPQPQSLYGLRAGLLLSRPPILTRAPTAFENAFYLYQKRLNERLSSPFARSFYFHREQPAGIDFALKFGDRKHTMTREIGRVTRVGRDAWDDEALFDEGAEFASPEYVRERLFTEAESRVSEDGEVLSFDDRLKIERPLPRETEADRTGDVRRLDRALDRTLFLVVKNLKGQWVFPNDVMRHDEALHETAARALVSQAGVNMNTWIVGRHPIAYMKLEPKYRDPIDTDDASVREEGRVLDAPGTHIFFLKGRIMAGQADISVSSDELRVTDFMWLTKEELRKQLFGKLFNCVANCLPAQ